MPHRAFRARAYDGLGEKVTFARAFFRALKLLRHTFRALVIPVHVGAGRVLEQVEYEEGRLRHYMSKLRR